MISFILIRTILLFGSLWFLRALFTLHLYFVWFSQVIRTVFVQFGSQDGLLSKNVRKDLLLDQKVFQRTLFHLSKFDTFSICIQESFDIVNDVLSVLLVWSQAESRLLLIEFQVYDLHVLYLQDSIVYSSLLQVHQLRMLIHKESLLSNVLPHDHGLLIV